MKKVAVIGDACLDLLRLGKVTRPSPEDPRCPVVQVRLERHELGMAANVAQWLAAVGSLQVRLYCHQRTSINGAIFHQECLRRKITLGLPQQEGLLTVKERLAVEEEGLIRYLVRLDSDSADELTFLEQQAIFDGLREWQPDAIIVVDYSKGFFLGHCGGQIVARLGSLAEEIGAMLILNSKLLDRWRQVPAVCVTCNYAEFQASLEFHTPNPERNLLVTKGERGVWIVEEDIEVPSIASRVVDVTGAGDAFLAGVAYQLLQDGQTPSRRDLVQTGQRWASHCVSQLGVGEPIAGQKGDRRGA